MEIQKDIIKMFVDREDIRQVLFHKLSNNEKDWKIIVYYHDDYEGDIINYLQYKRELILRSIV
jgi:hypothetical protein